MTSSILLHFEGFSINTIGAFLHDIPQVKGMRGRAQIFTLSRAFLLLKLNMSLGLFYFICQLYGSTESIVLCFCF